MTEPKAQTKSMRSLGRGAAIAGAVTFFAAAFGGATAASAAPQPIEIVEQAPEGTTRLWLDLESGDGVAPGSTAIQQALSRTEASAPVDLLIAGGALLLTAATIEVLRRRRARGADHGIEGAGPWGVEITRGTGAAHDGSRVAVPAASSANIRRRTASAEAEQLPRMREAPEVVGVGERRGRREVGFGGAVDGRLDGE